MREVEELAGASAVPETEDTDIRLGEVKAIQEGQAAFRKVRVT